jgi:hypothetical protein
MITLNFYKDRDNAEDIVLCQGQAAIDATHITRIVLIPDVGASIDSAVSPALFEWPVTVAGGEFAGDKGIRLKFGALGLTPGKHFYSLITYDSDNLDGVAWEPGLIVQIII